MGRQVEFLLDAVPGSSASTGCFDTKISICSSNTSKARWASYPGFLSSMNPSPFDLDLRYLPFARQLEELPDDPSTSCTKRPVEHSARPWRLPSGRINLPCSEGISLALVSSGAARRRDRDGAGRPPSRDRCPREGRPPARREAADGGSSGSAWLTDFHDAVAREAHVDLRRPRPQAILS